MGKQVASHESKCRSLKYNTVEHDINFIVLSYYIHARYN
jgi:hypothetical protein